jgi:HEAT repeat protein
MVVAGIVGTTQELCDPKRCSATEAIRIAKIRSREDHSFDLQIARFLNCQWMARRADVAAVERALEILSAIASPARLFGVLRGAMAQVDPGIRSKSAMALARHTDSLPILNKLVTDPDTRVRANTIEALWGRKIPEVAELLQRALKDDNHRVAINAAYALYLLDPLKHIAEVEAFVKHPQARFRTAAAWLIRKIGDARHLSLLKTLVRDDSQDVRRAAFRTLAALRPATTAVQ